MPNASKKHEYKSFGGHGMDVGVNRADDLDKAILGELKDYGEVSVLDLGCGAGGQAVRMAAVGARVTALDKYDFSQQFLNHNIEFIQGDLRDLPKLLAERQFDFVICQRTLHYLRYSEALLLLRFLKQITKNKLYLSTTGIDSEIGNNYPAKENVVEDRFGKLQDFTQELFGITESVCLYSQAEFEQLLEDSGWQIEKCWQSAFGNIKAIGK
ncbi:class I SAM-dependent methyltransferase [Candidatus Kaiserbacteria bacterium]|nr:class I SAM-dependent methyltransferase [Candidatus Kaiserbacteria bacterium]